MRGEVCVVANGVLPEAALAVAPLAVGGQGAAPCARTGGEIDPIGVLAEHIQQPFDLRHGLADVRGSLAAIAPRSSGCVAGAFAGDEPAQLRDA
ncbi:hypothetical protein DF3PA_100033 [Candidatus Defluviicoccus seviourii]|uniref:Uncharacterized protein n=1 Tax=Candidatus Defluviicoccus seviourii TaxID=2565273 RepID=A0A564WAN8_9PROT|nr:hypothetical protein DF3PA_100033 [Candidatus Defluviicoccus seviourii]